MRAWTFFQKDSFTSLGAEEIQVVSNAKAQRSSIRWATVILERSKCEAPGTALLLLLLGSLNNVQINSPVAKIIHSSNQRDVQFLKIFRESSSAVSKWVKRDRGRKQLLLKKKRTLHSYRSRAPSLVGEYTELAVQLLHGPYTCILPLYNYRWLALRA